MDSAVLPMRIMTLNFHLLARIPQRHPELILELQHLLDQKMVLNVSARFLRSVEKRPIIHFWHGEVDLFLRSVNTGLGEWLDITLTRQAAVVGRSNSPDEDQRQLAVMACHQKCLELFAEITRVFSKTPSPESIAISLAMALFHANSKTPEDPDAGRNILDDLRETPIDLGITQANGKGALQFLKNAFEGQNPRVDDGEELLVEFQKALREFFDWTLNEYREYLRILYPWTEEAGRPLPLKTYLSGAKDPRLTVLVINSTLQTCWEQLVELMHAAAPQPRRFLGNICDDQEIVARHRKKVPAPF